MFSSGKPVAAVLSEPQLQAEGVHAVQVVLDEPLVLAETELGVEVERSPVCHLGLKHHLKSRSVDSRVYRRLSSIGHGRSGGMIVLLRVE